MEKGVDGLLEDERKALRGSKFAPLPPKFPSSSCSFRPLPRVPHPGGPVTTNKAVALAKFLERKLQEPRGLESLNPALIESAVKNAKDTVSASGTSSSGRQSRHVASFDDSEEACIEVCSHNRFKKEKLERNIEKKLKKKKKNKKNKNKNKNKNKKLKKEFCLV